MSQRVLVLVGSIIVAGCSTTNNTTVVEPKCGAGTVLVDGECVSTGADASIDGESVKDSAVTVDSSATDETGKDTGATTLDAVSDTPSDTAVAGDPCPSKTANVNCSSSCAGGGSTMVNCAKTKCGVPFADTPRVKEADLPFVMRTPTSPGIDSTCAAGACASPLAYGMFVRTSFLAGAYFKATVAPPWKFYRHTSETYCPSSEFGQCVTGGGGFDILVGTTDPSAVSRNVVIESVPFGTTCP